MPSSTTWPVGDGLAIAGVGIAILVALLIWSLGWKGLALWKAARNGSAG